MICEATSVRSSMGLISAWVPQSLVTSNTLWACVILFWGGGGGGGRSLYKDVLFLSPKWGSGAYITRNLLMRTHFVNTSWKKSDLYADCTFPVQREEINVVKARGFSMRYSSRKITHEKIIATASNFWRQIRCSFQVKSGNVLLCIRQKNIWNSALTSNPVKGARQKSLRMLITCFLPETKYRL